MNSSLSTTSWGMEDCQLLGRFHQFQFPQLTEWSHLPIMSIRTGKFIQRPPHFHSFSTVTHLAGSQRLHKTALWISEALHPFPSMTFAPETLVESLLVESGGHFREVIFVARRDDHNPPQSAAHHQCHTSVASVHPELFWPSVIQNSCWETNITMENHHFQWENPLYNSYVKLPEVITITGLTKIVFQSQLVESKWTWVARSKICSNIIRFFQMLRHLFSTAPCASGMIWHDGAAWEMKSRQAPKTDPWRRWHMKPAMAWGATLPSGCGSKLGPPKNDHGSFWAESSKFEIENWEFWPMPLSL